MEPRVSRCCTYIHRSQRRLSSCNGGTVEETDRKEESMRWSLG